jgi:hypothetical protein
LVEALNFNTLVYKDLRAAGKLQTAARISIEPPQRLAMGAG